MKNLLKKQKTWLIAACVLGLTETAAKADYVTFTANATVTHNDQSVTYDKFEVVVAPKKGTQFQQNQYIKKGYRNNNNSYASIDITGNKVFIYNALVSKGPWIYVCKSGYLDNLEDSKNVELEISIPIVGNLDQDHEGIDCTFNGQHLSEN